MIGPANRFIALLDLDAFYSSVEVIENPELKGKELIIGGLPQERGVVAAASYEARKFGIHSAMPTAKALELCPRATILKPRHELYRQYSKQVMVILTNTAPLIEQVSIDEAYVELTSKASTIEQARKKVLEALHEIRNEVGLPCSAGLAHNKLVAKMACEWGKPNGFTVIPSETAADFLANQPIRNLPGIGPQTGRRLNTWGFSTLGQLASAPINQMTALMGPRGALIQRQARGEDYTPLSPHRESKSFSSETTFDTDISEVRDLIEQLESMATQMSKLLKQRNLMARTVTLKLRFTDFTTITRSASNSGSTADHLTILQTALTLLESNWNTGKRVRLIGIGVSNIQQARKPGQIPFPGWTG
jgi:DNA polymerase-4